MTHICISKLTIIGSDNGLSPVQRQAIIKTNATIMLIGTLGTKFSEIFSKIFTLYSRKCIWKYRLWNGLNVLIIFKRLGLIEDISSPFAIYPLPVYDPHLWNIDNLFVGIWSCSRSRITKNVVIMNQIWWQIITVIWWLAVRLLQTLAQAMTAQLLCHVQNFVVITWLEFGCKKNNITIKFEFWLKNH